MMDDLYKLEYLDFSSKERCEEYASFIQNHRKGSFTQSLEWCSVKKGWNHEAVILRNNENKIVAAMLVLIKSTPVLGASFLYSPRGPVCDLEDCTVVAKLLEGVKYLKKKYNAYLFKMDPFIYASDADLINKITNMGFKFVPGVPDTRTIQSRCNYILNIENKSQDEVLQSFHSKWRYNIRLAERKGVVCKICGPEAMDDFYKLMEETGKRHNFAIRSKDYFLSMLENMGDHCRLYMCYYEGSAVSGAIAVQYAGKTCYVYGASTEAARSVMPNYLMQWNMIKWAIENGCYIYDFQGVPFYFDENHPNYGVYRFKQGFNGEVVEYAGEFDYVFRPLYRVIAESLMKAYIDVLKISTKIKRKISSLLG